MEAIITVGCSASGKSTWAREFLQGHKSWVQIERDQIRSALLVEKKIISAVALDLVSIWLHWNFKWEKEVSSIVDLLIKNAADNGESIVISDTNLNQKRLESLIITLTTLGYTTHVKVFGEDLTLEELWKRDKLRLDSVGHDVIARQYQQFREQYPLYPDLKKTCKHATLPKAVIFDLDGTLFHMEGVRGPFEWDKVDQDTPDSIVSSALLGILNAGVVDQVIFLSGRDSVSREKTVKSLERSLWHSPLSDAFLVLPDIDDSTLFMRPEGDMRKDTVVKKELYRDYVYPHYDVIGVFDDRPSVCRLWYDLGIKVIHCKNPWIEF